MQSTDRHHSSAVSPCSATRLVSGTIFKPWEGESLQCFGQPTSLITFVRKPDHIFKTIQNKVACDPAVQRKTWYYWWAESVHQALETWQKFWHWWHPCRHDQRWRWSLWRGSDLSADYPEQILCLRFLPSIHAASNLFGGSNLFSFGIP